MNVAAFDAAAGHPNRKAAAVVVDDFIAPHEANTRVYYRIRIPD